MFDYDAEVDETQIADQGSGDATVPAVTGSDATGAGTSAYEYDGEKFNKDQMSDAIEAWRDREAWNASFKQRDQRDAAVRDAISAGFGKKLHEFDEKDLMDLKSFGLINSRLRSDPNFARIWEDTLINAYKQAGASTRDATAAARQDVADAKTGQPAGPAKLSPEVEGRLKRIDDFENMVVEQGLAQFQTQLEGDIKGSIDKVAGDVSGRFYPMIRNMVLQGLSGHTDVELLEKYQDGTLAREITKLSKEAAKTVRDFLEEKGQSQGAAVAAGKLGVPPAPAKGGVGEAVTALEMRPGSGMTRFNERLRRGLGQA